MIRVCVLTIILCYVKAQIPSLGFCPEYPPMPHFDMNRFLGKWYESERYFQFSEVASRCVVTDYAKAPSGKIYTSNEITNRLTGIKRIVGGSIILTGRKNEGKLTVRYETTPISTESTLTVLDTDYDSFAVIWSCSGFGPVHAESAWVMTRERLPDSQTLQQAYGVLDKNKISRTFFVKTDQAGCAVAASDLNAALGIAAIPTSAEQGDTEETAAKSVETSNLVDGIKAASVPEVLKLAAEKVVGLVKKPVEDMKLADEAVTTTESLENSTKQEEIISTESTTSRV